jgi:Sugar (and other) transporter.
MWLLRGMLLTGCRTYIIFSCFCFSMGVFVWFFIPETKGMSLEKMDDLFGVTELVQKTADAEHALATDGDKTVESHVEHVAR